MTKKIMAGLLCACVVALSPGLQSYAVAAQVGARGGAPLSAGLSVSAAPARPGVPLAGAPLSAALPGSSIPGPLPAAAVPGAAVPAALPQAASEGAPALESLLPRASELSLTPEQAAAMPAGAAREAGDSIMAKVLGQAEGPRAGSVDVEGSAGSRSFGGWLSRITGRGRASALRPPAPPAGRAAAPEPGPRRSKLLGLVLSLARVTAAGAAVWGLHLGAVALLPDIFGLSAVAAVWAVSSGLLLLPAGIYARARLGLRDSPRLTRVKWLLDGAIGAFLGAAAMAVPAFSLVMAAQGSSVGLPLAAAAGAGSLISVLSGGRLVDTLLTGGALIALPAVMAAGMGMIGLGPLIGLMALPVMTTIAFFLGQIISAAETGRPFAVPGSLQKLRFPAFNWVMIGVVFALTTGFGAAHSNLAFMLWTFFGNAGVPKWDKKLPAWRNALAFLLNFNVLYLGLLGFTAATAFTSPLTFLVIAFAGERAASWTEGLLGKMLPASKASPSTADDQPAQTLSERVEHRWPVAHHWLRMALLLGTMASIGFGMAYFVFGVPSLLKNLAIAGVISALPLVFSTWLIKKVMKLEPATPQAEPELHAIMNELRDKINARRAASGRKPIPLPWLGVSPNELPNAAATGLSPNKALVFMTAGIKKMLLEPEELREGLVRLLGKFPAASEEYQTFRLGLVGAIPGVTPASTPQESAQAILRADEPALRALGRRLLRGVMAHEFSHVMDRHMISGSVGGTISAGVAFASYGVMWAVGHAKALALKAWGRVFPTGRQTLTDDSRPSGPQRQPGQDARPEMLDPVSTGVVLKSLPALLRMFAALWVPIMLQIVQMAGSRNNEAQADDDGARLSEDPAALGLALGLLTTWQPKTFSISGLELPRLAALGHMMTVNPLQQLQLAGALPKQDPKSRPIGMADNFMLQLFLTHPDTMWRVRTLGKMARALGRGQGR